MEWKEGGVTDKVGVEAEKIESDHGKFWLYVLVVSVSIGFSKT